MLLNHFQLPKDFFGHQPPVDRKGVKSTRRDLGSPVSDCPNAGVEIREHGSQRWGQQHPRINDVCVQHSLSPPGRDIRPVLIHLEEKELRLPPPPAILRVEGEGEFFAPGSPRQQEIEATLRDHIELVVLHENDEVGLYPEHATHAEVGVKIAVRVRGKLVHSNAMELAELANHLRGRIPKSGLQLGSEDGNLVATV